jgi:hypothetical protein
MARNDAAALRLAHPTVVPVDARATDADAAEEAEPETPVSTGMAHPTVVPGRSD